MSLTDTPVKRRKRYERGGARNFQLAERDRDIIRAVFDHRFLNSDQIAVLMASPKKKIAERLTELFHAGYLDRPRAQHDYYVNGGAPLVYALGSRGAREIIAETDEEQAQLDWKRKNATATHRFIDHTIATSEFRITLAQALSRPTAGKGSDVQSATLVEGRALLAEMPPETQQVERPWTLRARVMLGQDQDDIGVAPDYAFALRMADGRRRPFVVEIDRGTMPVVRKDLRQTSILRKLLAYDAAWRAKTSERQWGFKTFRVLFVTATRERAANILAAVKAMNHGRGSDLFWAVAASDLTPENMLTPVWRDGRGGEQRLAT